ncbi:MAG TPA: hypothetical protein DD405_05065 [Desulfobacteraceae bacterium]|nr:hypothetical protein [Desulfobacteraceae bacterium]
MNYKFQSSEEAIRHGQQATRQDCKNMVKAQTILNAQYWELKKKENTLESFNARGKIVTFHQLLREALEEAGYGK